MNRRLLEQQLSELPLMYCNFFSTEELVFSERVRHICQSDCPMYGKSWACPPGVGTVAQCREKCLRYPQCLMIATVAEVTDIGDIQLCLATRREHENITNQVGELLRCQGVEPYILSTESCAICPRCAILDNQPCRFPERMHPCVESQGIVLTETAEKFGISFQYGGNVVTWFSLLLFEE